MRTIIPANAKLIPKDAERVFSGKIFDVYQWQQEMFDGSFETFEMLKRPDTVKILAIKDSRLLIVEEQQPNTQVFFDIPSGRHDNENENELEAAKRELLEETGMKFNTWKLIKVEQPYTKIDWFVYTYVASDFVSQTDQSLDNGEKIIVHQKTFEEVLELSKSPQNRYLPVELLDKAGSVDNILKLSEYSGT